MKSSDVRICGIRKTCQPSGSLGEAEHDKRQDAKTRGYKTGKKGFRTEPEFDMVFPGGFNQNSADTAIRRKNRRSFSVNRRRPSRKERVCNNQKAAALCLDIKIQPGIFDLFGNDF